ncbi:DUF6233 domain-containing protein [Streptomyces sp. NPDC056462]|uniref:DUF6233 domain-containing protein n=1 Tax=Streptomyces sp. NPDC056462 TaxID=3345826 RepID=UPI0036B41AB3
MQQRQAEEERGRRNRPSPPDWIVELGIDADRTPVQVHAGDCHMAGKRRRAVSRGEARRLLTAGLPGCTLAQVKVSPSTSNRPLGGGPGVGPRRKPPGFGYRTHVGMERPDSGVSVTGVSR